MTPLEVSAERAIPKFAVPFDEVLNRLSQLDRMYCEPDGSFLWVGPAEVCEPGRLLRPFPSWHFDGQLTDGGSHLAFLELKGYGTILQLEAILRTLQWPTHPIMFQLPEWGVFLSDDSFRAIFMPE